jgi:peptide-methionine (R)-S-oxide reductase
MLYNTLTPEEKHILEEKGTEEAFTGVYDNFYQDGTFLCRKCNAPLFSSQTKFNAGCGWPAFDDNFPHAIRRIPDPDGRRIEIECENCNAHLGHFFEGEHFTKKEIRHCVNSLSIHFIPEGKELPKVIHI